MLFNDYVSNNINNCLLFIFLFLLLFQQKNVKTIIFSELPQQDKIKYFNFLLENDINFSRDESGNYVALVKVLNPAFYGGADSTANPNQNISSSKVEQAKKENKSIINEPKKEEIKLRSDKNKSGQNASKSMPKNISDKNRSGDNKGYSNSGYGYGYNEDNSIRSKKKNTHKSNEHFEKEKKAVSIIYYNILFIIINCFFIFYSYQKKIFWIYSKVDIKNLQNQ